MSSAMGDRDQGPVAPGPPPAAREVAAVRRWLKVVGAVLVFVPVGGITLGIVLLRNPRIRAVANGLREGLGAVMAGQHAPGTDALRASGCTTAMVLDMNDVLARMAPKSQGNAQAAATPKLGNTVICGVADRGTMTCERVAAIYGAAVIPGAPFSVMVQAAHEKQPVCSGQFAPDGTRVGDFPSKPHG